MGNSIYVLVVSYQWHNIVGSSLDRHLSVDPLLPPTPFTDKQSCDLVLMQEQLNSVFNLPKCTIVTGLLVSNTETLTTYTTGLTVYAQHFTLRGSRMSGGSIVPASTFICIHDNIQPIQRLQYCQYLHFCYTIDHPHNEQYSFRSRPVMY